MTDQNQKEAEEQKEIDLLTELEESLITAFPDQEVVLITYDKFTSKVMNFLSSDYYALPEVFDSINKTLAQINKYKSNISKKFGNA
jgi:hypothetical protein